MRVIRPASAKFQAYIDMWEQQIMAEFSTMRCQSMDHWRTTLEGRCATPRTDLLFLAGFTRDDVHPIDGDIMLPFKFVIGPDGSIALFAFDRQAVWESHRQLLALE